MSTIIVHSENGTVHVQGALDGCGVYNRPLVLDCSGELASVRVGVFDHGCTIQSIEAAPLLPVRVGPAVDPSEPEVVIEDVTVLAVTPR